MTAPADVDQVDQVDQVDPEAPYGRRPNGIPYKRDPSAFAHLRGKAFGSMNGNGNVPKQRGATSPSSATKPPKRPSVAGPPKLDAAGYGRKIRAGFLGVAKYMSRRTPVPAAIIAVRSAAMADAWGRTAVSYPRVGRAIDAISKGGDLSEAIGSTVMTVVMIAHAQGLTQGTPMADIIDDIVLDVLHQFETSEEFGKMRERMAAAVVQGDAVENATA